MKCRSEGFLRFAESVPRCRQHGLPMRPSADNRPGRSQWKCIVVKKNKDVRDNARTSTTSRKLRWSRRQAGWFDDPSWEKQLRPLEGAST